eukprot:TRINITY_DN6268_c0_g1_i4.p1 TRINITY_DN6268_c0_g1~~TRINITY_DN6268_c0_g1_i4.p1  ORF type:complete len:325 (+),score=100.41 TRINITY_DN6268_c0_g1_i4:484-1458(+)
MTHTESLHCSRPRASTCARHQTLFELCRAGPVQVVKTVFGGGMFETIFGDVATLPLIEMLFQQMEGEGRLAAGAFQDDKQWTLDQQAALKVREQETCEQLARYLQQKMSLEAKDPEMFAEVIQSEAMGLIETPGGVELLAIVGYIYTQEATQFLGGPSGWAAEVAERGHFMSEGVGIVSQVLGVLTATKKLEKGSDGEGGAVKSASLQEAELQKEVMNKGLDTVWKIGKLLLEERLRTVVELILAPLKAQAPGVVDSMKEFVFTGEIKESELERNAKTLLQIGQCWSEAAALGAAASEDDHSGFASLKRQVDLATQQGAAGEHM